MSEQRRILLFNCDHVYNLDVVADLIDATAPKVGFEFLVEQHYFSLSEVSELSNKITSELEMDFAVLVVHAHEAQLSINEGECGYTKVYRALQQASGGKVIVVIGGDDNYKDKNEEKLSVISRWARRRIAFPQFKEEFLDGRKSFIFSWDKKHRPIHEAALLHYFDPSKEGQKFESPELTGETVHAEPDQSHMDLTITENKETDHGLVEELHEDLKGEQSAESIPPSIAAWIQEKEPISVKELSVLGWNAKPESLSAVVELIQRHRDQLNLADNPDVCNGPVQDMILYLENNPLKYCVLVVDAERINVVHDLKRKDDYLRLLETAENVVEVKIVVIVCCPLYMSKEDEKSLNCAAESVFNDSGKVFVARLRNGKLTIRGDDLVFILTSAFVGKGSNPQEQSHAFSSQHTLGLGTSLPHVQEMSASGSSEEFHNQTASSSNSEHVPNPTAGKAENQPLHPPTRYFNYKLVLPPFKTIMVLTRLRNGRISNRLEDVEYWMPGFIVPDPMERDLLEHFSKKTDVELAVVQERNQLVTLVERKIERHRLVKLELDEFIVLETRLKYGRISYEDEDVGFRCPNWRVPEDVVSRLQQDHRMTPNANLLFISDSQGNLRCIVQAGSFS